MIYTNLIYFLIVIVVLATSTPLEDSLVPFHQASAVFVLKMFCFLFSVRIYLSRRKILRAADYFRAESFFSILALVFFAIDVYLLDLKYYLGLLPLTGALPFLADVAGLAVYLFYLVALWLQLKPGYESVFGVSLTPYSLIKGKIRLALALISPWLILGLLHDLFILVPHDGFQDFAASPRGGFLLFLAVIMGAVIWFPALMVKILGCVRLPAGEIRDRIIRSCDQHGARFAGILSWPLHEGRAITAGVMGLVGRFRYLLVTPALLESLSGPELDAVIAHEIGHVKKKHLFLYIVIFLGFIVLAQLCVQPLLYMTLNTRLYYELLFGYEGDPGSLLAMLTGAPLVVVTVCYVRYVFGFFMRNFERQADLYALEVMGTAVPLINVFEKISMLSGNIREQPCWHHFGLGQRIDYLLASEHNQKSKAAHDRKIFYSLAVYFVGLVVSLLITVQIGELLVGSSPGRKIAEEVIIEKTRQEPGNPLWHQFHGDLLITLGEQKEAVTAFERSLALDQHNPEVLNNLAWLLLTAEKKQLRDPARALVLAKKAVEIQARSHILDTLAEAYWQNNQVELAVQTELKAIDQKPDNLDYYRKQLDKFSQSNNS